MPKSEWQVEGPGGTLPEYLACPRCSDVYVVADGHTCKGFVGKIGVPESGRPTTDVTVQWDQAQLAAPGYLGSKAEVQNELDDIARAIRSFHVKPPDMVMREASAYSARLTELCVLLHRVESSDRQYTRVRTQQVERFLVEVDRQFKTASRLLEAQRQDLELLK